MIKPVALTRSIRDGLQLPQAVPAHIQSEYYAVIIAEEAIGKGGNTQIRELTLNDLQTTGYVFCEGGRAVFINLKAYTGTAIRTNVHFSLGFIGTGSSPVSMNVKHLAIKQATDISGVTWGGQTYETRSVWLSHRERLFKGVDIQETEAILVQFS